MFGPYKPESLAINQHVDITRLEEGTILYLESEDCLYEFTLHHPAYSTGQLVGTNLPQPMLSQFLHCINPEAQRLKATSLLKGWIAVFKTWDCVIQTLPITAIRIQGKSWYYDL
jgi:hypothetical protein